VMQVTFANWDLRLPDLMLPVSHLLELPQWVRFAPLEATVKLVLQSRPLAREVRSTPTREVRIF
jgi:hypothetical protein